MPNSSKDHDDFNFANFKLLDLHDNDLRISLAEDKKSNNRTTIRYIRHDITASIHFPNIFGYYTSARLLSVKLLDISSKGVLISSPKFIRLNKKIRVILVFKSQKEFQIPAIVIRKEVYAPKIFGIKFNKMNHDLGNYLLETQTDLIFQDF